jgi:gliding motility-associated-like protein
MKLNLPILMLLMLLSGNYLYSQESCTITADSDVTEICLGTGVYLSSSGACADVLMDNDFENQNLGPGWAANCSPMFNNPCGNPPPGSNYYAWIGDASDFPRDLITEEYTVTGDCEICFDLRFAYQGDSSPCEGPDEVDEGVELQWSTNGSTWNSIIYFHPDGSLHPYNQWVGQGTSPVNSGQSTNFTSWGTYCFDVPAAASSTHTQFRWHQEQVTSQSYDHWGLDNVSVICPGPDDVINWYAGSNPNSFDDTHNPPVQYPTETTTYYVEIEAADGSMIPDTDSVEITVYNSSVDLGPDQVYCTNDTPITLDAGSGSDYDWSTDETTQTIDVSTSGDYSVIVTDSHGCTAEDEVHITINPSPTVDLGPDQTVCDYNAPITLDAGGGMDIYDWSTGDDTQTILVDSSDTYSVIVTDGNGCTESDSITVTVNPSPNPDLGPDQTICDYDTVSVVLDAGPGDIYQWSITEDTQQITVNESGTYAVTVTNSFGCTGTDSMILIMDILPDPNLGPDTVVCDYNAPIMLDPGTDPSFDYLWSDGSDSIDLEVNESGTYSVTVTEGVCTATDEIQVTINPSPSVDLGPDQYHCETEEPFVLDAGLGLSEYLWNTENTSRTQNVTETGTYAVTVTNEYDCNDADSMYFHIDTMPPIGIFHDTNYCINADAFYLEAASEGGTWEGTGIADQDTGLFVPQVVGDNTSHITYTVINGECTSVSEADIHVHALPDIKVINVQDVLCFGEATGEIQVAAPGSTSPEFDWVSHDIYGAHIQALNAGVYNLVVTDAYSCQSDTFLIVSQPSELLVDYESGHPSCIGNNDGYIEFEVSGGVLPYLYSWEMGESDSPSFNDLYEGEYNFVISDDHNCTENVSIKLIDTPVECIRIPNAFTPNGDGTNDTWEIENLDMFNVYQVQVFNRWGQLLYCGTPGDESWDGTTLEGKKVPTGAYIYVIKLDSGRDKRSGTVSVVY